MNALSAASIVATACTSRNLRPFNPLPLVIAKY
jgi:hypothetical protein